MERVACENISRLSFSGAVGFAHQMSRRLTGKVQFGLHAYPKWSSSQVAFKIAGVFECAPHGTSFEFPVEILVPSSWRSEPPQVRVKASWIRYDADWHVYQNGFLCWVPSKKWNDAREIAEEILPQNDARELLLDWMVGSVVHLVGCHRLAEEIGLEKWSAEWDQYSHDRLGQQEYERERAKFKKQLYIQIRSQPTDAKVANAI